MAEPLPSDLSNVDPADAWKPWDGAGWNRKWVAHLYRRAAFGATPAEADRALKDGFAKTLTRLEQGEPDAAERLELLTETGQHYADIAQLRGWWLYTMLESGHPLREKLTLFWHNHFATSHAKVRSTHLMYRQNVLLRRHALGHFRPFLLDMSKDTAMLLWLDSNENVKGKPNENFAREVMELFSLGVGNYTEKDIQEAARAFTGWQVTTRTVLGTDEDLFQYKADLHDDGSKTIFGQTGNFGGEDVVKLCCDRPSCATFLVGKLYAYLVSETRPPKGLLDPLAERFRSSDYDIGALVRTMLGSRLFFSEHAYRKRVKWPVEYVIGACRAVVPDRVPPGDLLEPLSKMGQALFAPPNVKGWRTGTDWLNSATLLARNNFAEAVAMGHWARANLRTQTNARFATVKAVEAPGGAPSKPTDPALDPAKVIFETKPKTPAAVVARIGDLLYGEPVPAAAKAKIEKFLVTPTPPEATTPAAPGGPVGPAGGSAPGTLPPPPTKSSDTARPVAEAKKPEPKKDDAKKPEKPKPLQVGSPEFTQKAREALHALMCLPEYQLD